MEKMKQFLKRKHSKGKDPEQTAPQEENLTQRQHEWMLPAKPGQKCPRHNDIIDFGGYYGITGATAKALGLLRDSATGSSANVKSASRSSTSASSASMTPLSATSKTTPAPAAPNASNTQHLMSVTIPPRISSITTGKMPSRAGPSTPAIAKAPPPSSVNDNKASTETKSVKPVKPVKPPVLGNEYIRQMDAKLQAQNSAGAKK